MIRVVLKIGLVQLFLSVMLLLLVLAMLVLMILLLIISLRQESLSWTSLAVLLRIPPLPVSAPISVVILQLASNVKSVGPSTLLDVLGPTDNHRSWTRSPGPQAVKVAPPAPMSVSRALDYCRKLWYIVLAATAVVNLPGGFIYV